ncbi:MAG: hypothetical protein WC254_01875 [Candidatus Woesearchaeota archaeon]|jgi:hypothetical protein
MRSLTTLATITTILLTNCAPIHQKPVNPYTSTVETNSYLTPLGFSRQSIPFTFYGNTEMPTTVYLETAVLRTEGQDSYYYDINNDGKAEYAATNCMPVKQYKRSDSITVEEKYCELITGNDLKLNIFEHALTFYGLVVPSESIQADLSSLALFPNSESSRDVFTEETIGIPVSVRAITVNADFETRTYYDMDRNRTIDALERCSTQGIISPCTVYGNGTPNFKEIIQRDTETDKQNLDAAGLH